VHSVEIIYWQEDDGLWLGYLREHPAHRTQGETLVDLRQHLWDLYRDLTSGAVPGIRMRGELRVHEARRSDR